MKLFAMRSIVLAVLLGGLAIPARGYDLTFFAGTDFTDTATLDTALSLGSFTIEDFEDTALVPGLSYSIIRAGTDQGYGTGVLGPYTEIAQVFPVYPYAGGTPGDGAWDGSAALLSSVGQQWNATSSGYVTALYFASPLDAVGVGLSVYNYPGAFDVHLHVNGADLGQLDTRSEWNATDYGRNLYVRIDRAGADAPIASIAIETRSQSSGDPADGLHFLDHVALLAAPEPAAVGCDAIAAACLLLLATGSASPCAARRPSRSPRRRPARPRPSD